MSTTPSAGEWIMQMWYKCTMEFCSAVKKIKVMKFAIKWVELEKTIVNEVSQTQKDKYHCVFQSFSWSLDT